MSLMHHQKPCVRLTLCVLDWYRTKLFYRQLILCQSRLVLFMSIVLNLEFLRNVSFYFSSLLSQLLSAEFDIGDCLTCSVILNSGGFKEGRVGASVYILKQLKILHKNALRLHKIFTIFLQKSHYLPFRPILFQLSGSATDVNYHKFILHCP